jgi:amino acid adenylation domain-containing protein
LKAGGCYLPLDPSFPDERINYMLENSETKILICQDSLYNKFHLLPNISLINIDNESGLLNKYSIVKPDINLTPQFFAYILYTSGSTGKPKGVRIHHQAVINFINSMIHSPGINEDDILLAVTTLSFDISVLELFLPLSVGATVIIADTGDTYNGLAFIDLIEKHNITFLQATPSLWNFLLASGWKGNSSLKGICGGEALPSNLVREVLPKIGEFWNFYGPTETTVWSTGIKITDPDAPVLIGKPIDNTKIYILNNNNKQLPVGATGEICIGGLGVAKGYFKNPEITAQKFIPFEDDGIIYKTGDLGRFIEDGNIEFLGRIDNQIKLKNIE